ncbi:MAG: methyltransferase [Oscillospiraceae bacterium]|nr:methyltransferase [Oscillospiraceae bacterium]
MQKTKGVRFGSDTILLTDFAAQKAVKRALDLGCGCGVISLLLADKYKNASFDAVEIQEEYADMAKRSVLLNRLDSRINIIHADANLAKEHLRGKQYDLITCNPPYFADGGVLPAETEAARIARSSDSLTPTAIAKIAAGFLQTAGRLCVVLPAFRFLEMCDAVREYAIEPKRVRFVQDRIDRPPYLFLLEAIRGAKAGLHYEPAHIAH